MAIDPITSQAQSAQQRATLADNFDTFLILLTAQLRNQDPLSPMDSTQFTQQLVQFSQVEQQIRTNENLESMIAQNQAAAAALPLSYLGKAALIENDRTVLMAEGGAAWTFSLGRTPASVAIDVKNGSGQTVYSTVTAGAAGAQGFTWDGIGNDGERAAAGLYTLKVNALDSGGRAIAATINTIDQVTGVDFTSGLPRIVTGSGIHDLADILGILDR